MPIKFRCPHCQQFLGISRSQASNVVDCPGCGRSIRVPNLDGSVAAMPKPKIDLQDDSLVSALDQLASLSDGVEPVALAAEAAPKSVVKAQPLTSPRAVALDVVAEREQGVPDKKLPWIEMDKELAGLANAAGASAPRGEAPALRSGLSRRDVLVACVTALAGWPVAWWLGRQSRSAVHSVASAPESKPVDNAVPHPAAAAGTETAPGLAGRITYETADGQILPDAGARVLLLPENRPGTTLLSIDGFRAGASETDAQLARDALKMLGGTFAIADPEGRYRAELSSSGLYELLMISRYQPRSAVTTPAELVKALGRFFDRPAQLIGQTQFEYTSHFRFAGRDSAVRDQVFRKS